MCKLDGNKTDKLQVIKNNELYDLSQYPDKLIDIENVSNPILVSQLLHAMSFI